MDHVRLCLLWPQISGDVVQKCILLIRLVGMGFDTDGLVDDDQMLVFIAHVDLVGVTWQHGLIAIITVFDHECDFVAGCDDLMEQRRLVIDLHLFAGTQEMPDFSRH